MFERFTNAARHAVMQAQVESRALRHNYIGTEHLLLALMVPADNIAGEVLAESGVDADSFRAAIVREVGVGPLSAIDEMAPNEKEALRALGIDVDEVRARVEETFGPGALDPTIPTSRKERRRLRRRTRCRTAQARGAFTPRSKKCLELALREALALGHNHIGTEHLLLGILREGEGLAAEILVARGIHLGELRERVLARLGRAA